MLVFINYGVHILEYCDLRQQCCEDPQVTRSLSILSIVFYSVLKGSDNDIVHLPSIIGILGSVHLLVQSTR